MKRKNFKSKLNLNKTTITSLNSKESARILGGDPPSRNADGGCATNQYCILSAQDKCHKLFDASENCE